MNTNTKFCFNAYMKANRKSRKSRGSDNYYGGLAEVTPVEPS